VFHPPSITFRHRGDARTQHILGNLEQTPGASMPVYMKAKKLSRVILALA